MAKAADEIKIGNVLDMSTQQGPQIHKAQFDKVMYYIESGKKEGARLVTGGHRVGNEGYFIRPTVFADVHNSQYSNLFIIQNLVILMIKILEMKIVGFLIFLLIYSLTIFQAQEEIFGPVVVLIPFKTEEEAVKIANDTNYGLAAAVFSKHADQIPRVMRQLKAGTVWIVSVVSLKL